MKIVNIVISGKLSKAVDVECLPGVVYNPGRFNGAVYQHDDCTFLVFKNGSFVCLGARKRSTAKSCIAKLCDMLNTTVKQLSVKNMVMSDRLEYGVDIDALYERVRRVKGYVTYENELFNGIVWKESGGTIRLFHTGSYFVTGLCRKRELVSVCKNVRNICREFKK